MQNSKQIIIRTAKNSAVGAKFWTFCTGISCVFGAGGILYISINGALRFGMSAGVFFPSGFCRKGFLLSKMPAR